MITNLYKAIANEELYQNDPVVIRDGICMKPKFLELREHHETIYSVLDNHLKKGDTANLAGQDTVLTIN